MREIPEGCREIITDNFTPAGYNIGTAAGQTVMHCRATLFPATREIRITWRVVAGGVLQGPPAPDNSKTNQNSCRNRK